MIPEPTECDSQREVLGDLTAAFAQWRQEFPRENRVFQIGELDPMLCLLSSDFLNVFSLLTV